MEQLLLDFKRFCDRVQNFFDLHPLPCRCKFKPRRCPPRKHAPVSSLYLLDYDRRIAELGLEHEPLAFKISGQRLTFRKGRWSPQSCHGLFPSGQSDLLKNARERNRMLQEQNNVLQLKLELVMDMLTETTANLLVYEEDEEGTEEQEEKEEEEEEEEEKKACLKKLPKQSNQYEVDSSDFDYDEELMLTQRSYKYAMPPTSTEDDSDYSSVLNTKVCVKMPQYEAKPKVCPKRRAAAAKLRARPNKRPTSRSRGSLPPKTRSSPKVCRLELEPEPEPELEPKPKICPRRRAESKPKPKAKAVKETDGVWPMKRGSRV